MVGKKTTAKVADNVDLLGATLPLDLLTDPLIVIGPHNPSGEMGKLENSMICNFDLCNNNILFLTLSEVAQAIEETPEFHTIIKPVIIGSIRHPTGQVLELPIMTDQGDDEEMQSNEEGVEEGEILSGKEAGDEEGEIPSGKDGDKAQVPPGNNHT
jgi:hypothetical protein